MLRNRPLFFAGLIFAGIVAAASPQIAAAQMVSGSPLAASPDASIPTASTVTTNPGVASSSPIPTPSPALKTVPQATLFPTVTDYGNIQGPPTSTVLTEEQDAKNRSLKEIMRPPVPITFTPYSSRNPYANENPYTNQVGLPNVDLNAPLHSNQAQVISGPQGANQLTPAANGSNGSNWGNGANGFGANGTGTTGAGSNGGRGPSWSGGPNNGGTNAGTNGAAGGFNGNGAGNGAGAGSSGNLAAAIAEALQAIKANGGANAEGTAVPANTWRPLPPAGTSADLKDVKKQSIIPPFVISAASRSFDLSRIWWSPELLSIRIGRPTGGEEGVIVPWRRSPGGFPAAILTARLPTIENRQVIIKQAVSMMWVDGSWVAEGSSMAVSLKGKDGKEEQLITPADGQGMWRIHLAKGDSVEVWRWTAAALNGCRTTLAEKLNNEELRQLLINSGEVVWRISPDQSLTKT